MKKLSFIIGLCIVSLSINAQDTTKTKQHLNEFGIDATGFLKQYLNFGQQNSSYYIPTYYLTYRRYFGCGNLRVQLGGSYTNDQLPNNYSTAQTNTTTVVIHSLEALDGSFMII